MQRLFYTFNESYDVHYSYRAGNTTIVFLHGYLQSEIVWHPFISILPKELGIISIDLPGHGDTFCFGENYFHTFSQAISEILSYHKIACAHFVAHSMGGYQALDFLRHFSNRLISLSLLHSTPLPDSSRRIKEREREIAIIKRGKIHLLLEAPFDNLFAPQNRLRLAHYAKQYSDISLKMTTLAMFEAMSTMSSRGDFIDICKTAKQPIQLIAGRYDIMLSIERVHECQIKIPNIEYHFLQNCGHICFIEEPYEVAVLIIGMVKKCHNW